MTSKIKVDNINKVSDDSNIIKKCGTTITLGASGDSIALASGASQTGFGREGSVDWQTSSIKTATFTAANGEGYFINSGSAITMNLPAGSPGAIVAVADYARNFSTYNLTVSPDGSEKIGGTANSATLAVDGQAATFVYVDSTKGWINVQNAEDTETGTPPYIVACGGNTTITCGDFKTHIFTGPGTFAVTNAGGPSGSNKLDYLVIAAGGGGGGDGAGGGGGGGFRVGNSYSIPAPTMSPLTNPTGLTASIGSFPISVGAGGTAGTYSPATQGGDGANSVFSTIISTGGGGGGSYISCSANGRTGGSGGGGTRAGVGGAGNTPPVSPSQGNAGAPGGPQPNGDGGGGAGAVGGNSGPGSTVSGVGGAGSFIGNPYFGPTAPSYGDGGPVSSTRYFSGGGGGGGDAVPSNGGAGGDGGGGAGGSRPSPSAATAGTANTGGGGGGSGVPGNAGAGGSGIVMIRYKFQN